AGCTEGWLCRSCIAFYGGIGNIGRFAGARNFTGAIAGAAVVSGDASGASVQRTGRGVGAIVKREGRKGGRTRSIKFVGQANRLPRQPERLPYKQVSKYKQIVRAGGYWL